MSIPAEALTAEAVHTHTGGPSRSAYQSGCRHPDCRRANSQYQRVAYAGRVRPDTVWMPLTAAGPTRRHIGLLAAAGIGTRRLARLSGVARSTLDSIVSRRVRRVTTDTAAAVMAVTVADATDTDVDRAATDILVADLMSEGYSLSGLSALLGRPGVLERGRVTERLAAQIAALHARLLGLEPLEIDGVPVEPEWSWPPPLGAWADRARCRPQPERPALTVAFFPGRGDDTHQPQRACERCPVRQECLDYALAHREVVGVWGGTTAEERRRMREQARVGGESGGTS